MISNSLIHYQMPLLIYKSFIKGYVNDSGGESYCGITRKNFPKWDGWKIIDTHKLKYNEELPELKQPVNNFYKYVWDKLRCNELKNKQYAKQIFEEAVGSGLSLEATIKTIQENAGLPVTGRMGNTPVKAINGMISK